MKHPQFSPAESALELPARRASEHYPVRLIPCLMLAIFGPTLLADDNRYQSDSDARYLHHIPLYDIDNRKITPESTRPYSPMNTCGRCHDYESISHGWHFNAFQSENADGRPGEPWIWTDPKTGTQLPLSYRDWSSNYSPLELGISPWEMTHQFGSRLPGGNMGKQPDPVARTESDDTESDDTNSETPDEAENVAAPEQPAPSARWQFSGSLEIDCMVCHAVSGGYDFNERRRQIEEQNFAWAPTAALRLGQVDGRVSTIRDGSDPNDEATQKRVPVVAYDAARFEQDGSVFMDLIRKPSSNACLQCHSHRMVDDHGIEPRWNHDDDVHLRAGMVCADCHRNGIDHHIVRGYESETHPAGADIATLSCKGCHLGVDESETGSTDASLVNYRGRGGRLGAPQPVHAGLPPLHFDKLSCTACHGGPIPGESSQRTLTSLAHGLGEKGHRTGEELPALLAPVYAKGPDGRVYPHRAMWPAFWGYQQDDQLIPLPPSEVYEITRRSLRVRSDFIEEVLKPKLSSSDLKEILGEQRADKSEEWSEDEIAKVNAAQAAQGRSEFESKVYAALTAIETERKVQPAVYVSSGIVYAKGEQEGTLIKLQTKDARATAMQQWPLAHNVRPAGWALGAGGCTDCHSDQGKIFTSTVAAAGPGPDQGEPVMMATIQGVDPGQRLSWNEMFQARPLFKLIVAGSVAFLLMIVCFGIGAWASRAVSRTA